MSTALLIPIAAKLGLPILKRILAKHGGETGGVIADVIGDLAEGLSVAPTPEAVADAYADDPKKAGEAIVAVEDANGEKWLSLMEQGLRGQFDLLMAEQSQGGWTANWRPGGMYLIGFLWAWTFVLLPVANAALKASIVAPDLSVLSWLTGLFMSLYMGGHTIKDIADKAREAVLGRKA